MCGERTIKREPNYPIHHMIKKTYTKEGPIWPVVESLDTNEIPSGTLRGRAITLRTRIREKRVHGILIALHGDSDGL